MGISKWKENIFGSGSNEGTDDDLYSSNKSTHHVHIQKVNK